MPVEQIDDPEPRSNAVRAYSSTRSGFRDEDMMRTSCGMPNFSRIRPAWRMIGSSEGDAARTPTTGVARVTSAPSLSSGRSGGDVAPPGHAVERDVRRRLVRALPRVSDDRAPMPVDASTRPPAVTTLPSRLAGPRMEHDGAGDGCGGVQPLDRHAGLVRSRVAAAREDDGDRGVLGKDRPSASGEPVPSRMRPAARARSRRIRGSTTWVSGSPNRQLNSRTFGPSVGEHQTRDRADRDTAIPSIAEGADGRGQHVAQIRDSVDGSSHGSGE